MKIWGKSAHEDDLISAWSQQRRRERGSLEFEEEERHELEGTNEDTVTPSHADHGSESPLALV